MTQTPIALVLTKHQLLVIQTPDIKKPASLGWLSEIKRFN